MKITEATKISILIKENPQSIEAIASLAEPLEKLKNPLLRKIMASRVTIAEAARVGGVTVSDFIKALTPLGFEFNTTKENNESKEFEKEPLWLQQAAPENINDFDVRELLSKNNDPLKQILEKYKNLARGQILCIINSFEPIPLIALLKNQGAESYIRNINGGEYHTFFLKPIKSPEGKSVNNKDNVVMVNESTFNEIISKFNTRTVDMDVRQLEMPEPMHKILDALHSLPDTHALNILHKRLPIYLLEALADKNYQIFIYDKAKGDVRLLITKQVNHG